MSAHNPLIGTTRRFRLLKAYSTSVRVFMSYATRKWYGRFKPDGWFDEQLPALHEKNSRLVVQTILDLRGVWIKIGQLVSILTNFLPEGFRVALEGLQDRIPSRPYSQIRERIREELGKDPSELFAHIDETAIASASLAQVHRARLHDGREVAVKVQHAGIEEIVPLDLKAMHRIIRWVGKYVGVRGLEEALTQFESVIIEELDFRKEAANMIEVEANLADDRGIDLPSVVPEYSAGRVLTTTFEEGVKVTDLEALERLGIDRHRLAERIVEAYCAMIFSDGVFHADPHPGNILVRADGTIVFIDFGAVARLTDQMKEGMPRILLAVLRSDREEMIAGFTAMGFVARDGHRDTVAKLIDFMQEQFLDDVDFESWTLSDLTAQAVMAKKMESISNFMAIDVTFRELTRTFQVPRDWLMLERTILLLIGLCTYLYPDMNPLKIVRPYVEKIVFGPGDDWRSVLVSLFTDAVLALGGFAAEVERFFGNLENGWTEPAEVH